MSAVMGKKIIVTGASGFTGQYVVKELLEHRYNVIATYKKNNRFLKDGRVKWCQVDLTNKDDCMKLIKSNKPYAVIHLAAQNNMVLSKDIPEETLYVNNTSSVNILESVRLYSLKTKCILAGSAAIYHATSNKEKLTENSEIEFGNAYTLSKIYQEQIAKLYQKYGLKIICTRPFNYTGCNQEKKTFISSVCQQIVDIDVGNNIANRTLRLGNINVYRDFSDVRDVAKAYRLLLNEDVHLGIYNISSGKAIQLREIVEYLCGKINKRIEIVTDPSLLRKDDTLYICGDNSLLKKETGWDNTYTIFDTLDWMYENSIEMARK